MEIKGIVSPLVAGPHWLHSMEGKKKHYVNRGPTEGVTILLREMDKRERYCMDEMCLCEREREQEQEIERERNNNGNLGLFALCCTAALGKANSLSLHVSSLAN